jgi:hypothetical protein
MMYISVCFLHTLMFMLDLCWNLHTLMIMITHDADKCWYFHTIMAMVDLCCNLHTLMIPSMDDVDKCWFCAHKYAHA